MIINSEIIKNGYRVLNPNNKLGRDIKKGKYIKLKNNLYETDKNVSGYYLAGAIYGPSYLSFDFALFYHGLIPERVYAFTSATFAKKKKKYFKNFYGDYYYRDVPSNVYNIGVNIVTENGYSFQIASKEKAICDKLYTLDNINNYDNLKIVLYYDLRIDINEIKTLNVELIEQIANNYGSRNVELFAKYVKGGHFE